MATVFWILVHRQVVDGETIFEFPRVPGADDAQVTVEFSYDLLSWSPADSALLSQTVQAGGLTIMQWAFDPGERRRKYARIVVTLGN